MPDIAIDLGSVSDQEMVAIIDIPGREMRLAATITLGSEHHVGKVGAVGGLEMLHQRIYMIETDKNHGVYGTVLAVAARYLNEIDSIAVEAQETEVQH